MPVNFSYPITFLPCKSLEKTRNFYAEILKLPVVLEQAKCLIFQIGKSDNAAFWGFCSHYTEFLTNPEKIKVYLFGTETITDWKIGSTIIYCLLRGYNTALVIFFCPRKL